MLLESFEHAQADIDLRLLIEARNEAESVVQATEKSLRRPDFHQIAEEELQPGELQRIDEALAALKAVITGDDREQIHQRTHALNHATQHLAEVMMNRSVRQALAGKNVKDM
jgi:molecular chaperone HscA